MSGWFLQRQPLKIAQLFSESKKIDKVFAFPALSVTVQTLQLFWIIRDLECQKLLGFWVYLRRQSNRYHGIDFLFVKYFQVLKEVISISTLNLTEILRHDKGFSEIFDMEGVIFKTSWDGCLIDVDEKPKILKRF